MVMDTAIPEDPQRENLALHHASMKGHGDIINMLVKAGSHIDAQDKNGWTSLINASYFCQPEAVKCLLENKCDPHIKNTAGRHALHELCRSISKEEDKLAEIARMLIEAKIDMDAKCQDLGEADFTSLMFCAYHNHPKVAEELIKAKCDINLQGRNGWTALHWAVDRNNIDVINVLLKSGIDVNLKGSRNDTALDRSLDNKVRKILAEAMGISYVPLEGHELKLRREALEAERKARLMFDVDSLEISDEQIRMNRENAEQDMDPRTPYERRAAKQSEVLKAMQEQMKQAQTQLRSRRLQRQRSMPSHLFPPPPPPQKPEAKEAPAAVPAQSLFDSIGFIDSDEEAENSTKPAENSNLPTENSIKENGTIETTIREATPESGMTTSNSMPEGGLTVPSHAYESRGYVTTDEGESDSESESEAPSNSLQKEDSGLSTADCTSDTNGLQNAAESNPIVA